MIRVEIGKSPEINPFWQVALSPYMLVMPKKIILSGIVNDSATLVYLPRVCPVATFSSVVRASACSVRHRRQRAVVSI